MESPLFFMQQMNSDFLKLLPKEQGWIQASERQLLNVLLED